MNTRIDTLSDEVAALMQGHLTKRDFDSVNKLSNVLARLQVLKNRSKELDSEVAELESTIMGLNGQTSQPVGESLPHLASRTDDSDLVERAGPQTIRVEIDWKSNGKLKENEVILQPKAADSMAAFLVRLVQEFGPEVLGKLSRIRINRGPLISRTPATDFINHTQGDVYAHKRLKGTDYFVLTHSQTSQKVEDIKRACNALGLKPGSVRVTMVSRAEGYGDAFV